MRRAGRTEKKQHQTTWNNVSKTLVLQTLKRMRAAAKQEEAPLRPADPMVETAFEELDKEDQDEFHEHKKRFKTGRRQAMTAAWKLARTGLDCPKQQLKRKKTIVGKNQLERMEKPPHNGS